MRVDRAPTISEMVLKDVRFDAEDVARFRASSHPVGMCIEWVGERDDEGYGVFYAGGKAFRAHRVAHVVDIGPIDPPSSLVLHECDNPACVSPGHLKLGTQADNMADMVRRGRSLCGDRHPMRVHPERAARGERHGLRVHPERAARGERHGRAKLTWDAVREMRALHGSGEKIADLARRFGVNYTAAKLVVLGKTWREVTPNDG